MVQNVNKIKYNENYFLIDVMFWSYELFEIIAYVKFSTVGMSQLRKDIFVHRHFLNNSSML